MLICFVINPISGGIDKNMLNDLIKSRSKELNFEYNQFFTSGGYDDINGDHDFPRLVNFSKKTSPDILAAVGGDGTINLVARVAITLNKTLGILPAGSANGLAGELKIPRDYAQAIEILVKGQSVSVDTLLVNGKYLSLHLSDVGLNALIVKRFESGNTRGLMSYAKYLLNEILFLRSYRFLVRFPNRYISTHAVMIAFANTAKYGNGAVVNPLAIIDDGKFEVCIFKPFSIWEIFSITRAFFAGTLDNTKFVQIIRTDRVEIANIKNRPLQVDGEYIGTPREIKVEVNPASLRLLISANVPSSLFCFQKPIPDDHFLP